MGKSWRLVPAFRRWCNPRVLLRVVGGGAILELGWGWAVPELGRWHVNLGVGGRPIPELGGQSRGFEQLGGEAIPEEG